MRHSLLVVLLSASLGGCATGYASDWFRDRPSIINPQLIRYGMDVQQSRCVSQRLGARLSRQRLRQFHERAVSVRQGLYDPTHLTLRDLRAVANAVGDSEVRLEFDNSVASCGVTQAAAPAAASTASLAALAPTSGGVPVDMTPATAGAASAGTLGTTWLNLGAADSGQSIAINAMSILQEGTTRTAWFRMTDPDSGGPSNNSYRLRVDCEAGTVQPLALRQADAAGAQLSLREYTPAEAAPGPAESGTVLEIAFLSLCT